eukprot:m.430696 g.430696  ORF g.430696 m.430696 type:complete len:311 (-) comp17203_c0_seq1:236-1168(-)
MPFFLFDPEYYKIKEATGLSQAQEMTAYLGGSMFQTVMDNPVTAYRQLVQQYAKDVNGKVVDPKIAVAEANATFKAHPITASLSGVMPRIIGVFFKRVPKFGFLLGISYALGEDSVGSIAAFGASILSAPFINPIRMIEKQQRSYFRQTGTEKPIMEILRESRAEKFRPLFRGTIPLVGHSMASALLGLVGQPELQKYIKKELGSKTEMGRAATGLVASAVVSPIYVVVTNPLSRLEVIMQTAKIDGKGISAGAAVKEVIRDAAEFGLAGAFRGQGIGIFKAVISLTLFHEGRIFLTEAFRTYNKKNEVD